MSSNSEPPLDLADPAVKKFIEDAKAAGAVDPKDVWALLPRNASLVRLVDAMAMLEKMGIKNTVAMDAAKTFAEMPGINGRPHIAEVEARQGVYLTASSTLTQFNAILTGILGVMLASEQPGILKVTAAFALGLHILATLLLWWAARPITQLYVDLITERPRPSKSSELIWAYVIADRTFRNYRRGWRTTLLALLVSTGVACLFVLNAFGFPLSGML